MSRRWTEEEKAEAIRLRKEGVPLKEIAARIGRTERAVNHVCYDKPTELTGRKKPISEKAVKYIQRHFKNTPTIEICRKFGIGASSVIRYARKMGLRKTKQYMAKRIRDAAEAAKRSHLANGTYPPKGYRIPKSEENWFKPGEAPVKRIGRRKEAARLAKSVESRNRTIASERRRIHWGMDQKTKLRLVSQSRSKLNYRYNLRKCGYVEDPSDHNVYYYCEATRRGVARERNAERYRIKILPLPERQQA